MIPTFTISDEEYWDGDGTIVYLNPDNIVAVEPMEVSLFSFSDKWRRKIEASRIITNASMGVYTRRNGAYDVMYRNLPQVETKGGGSVEYLVPLEPSRVISAIRTKSPITCTNEVMVHIESYRGSK